jgi:hypothetical protein
MVFLLKKNRMKKSVMFFSLFLLAFTIHLRAQHVSVRLNFPVGVSVNAPGPPPYAGAVWIAPEWRWDGNGYVHVPGYWMRIKHKRGHWQRGYWKHTRRGYFWIPGRWH